MKALGATVIQIGHDSVISESAARAFATAHQLPYLSPYNDPVIMAGQGTLGLETVATNPATRHPHHRRRGGGLIGGVAAALKSQHPTCNHRRLPHQLSRNGRIGTLARLSTSPATTHCPMAPPVASNPTP
jgi:hypothetical protein